MMSLPLGRRGEKASDVLEQADKTRLAPIRPSNEAGNRDLAEHGEGQPPDGNDALLELTAAYDPDPDSQDKRKQQPRGQPHPGPKPMRSMLRLPIEVAAVLTGVPGKPDPESKNPVDCEEQKNREDNSCVNIIEVQPVDVAHWRPTIFFLVYNQAIEGHGVREDPGKR